MIIQRIVKFVHPHNGLPLFGHIVGKRNTKYEIISHESRDRVFVEPISVICEPVKHCRGLYDTSYDCACKAIELQPQASS